MPEQDNQLNFEAIKLSAVNTLKKGLAVAGMGRKLTLREWQEWVESGR